MNRDGLSTSFSLVQTLSTRVQPRHQPQEEGICQSMGY